MDKKEVYLGDGLYYEYDGYQIRLFAAGEYHVNQVFLEPEVLARFLEQIKKDNLTTTIQ